MVTHHLNQYSSLLDVIKNVNGYLRDDEAHLLYSLASKCKSKGVIVEIGSWEGKSTICLGLGSKQNKQGKIYAIDPHEGSTEHKESFGKVNTFKNFDNNIRNAGVANLVQPLVMSSHQAVKKVKEPIELLFIDGAHDYESVKQDYLDWAPKVIDGGVIAFHDTVSWPGPKKVVKENVFMSGCFKQVRVVGSITYGVKSSSVTMVDQMLTHYVYLTKVLRELLVYLTLPKPFHTALKAVYYRIQ